MQDCQRANAATAGILRGRLAAIRGLLPMLTLLAGCQNPAGPAGVSAERRAELATRADLSQLIAYMRGSFSSAPQAAKDPDFRDIRLEIVPIWSTRDDGFWLYVEQAAAEALDRPYRQRIYQVVIGGGGTFESRVFELPGDPLEFAGAFRQPARFDSLTPAQLAPRRGCTVTLRRDGPAFVGSTSGEACESALRGAKYATSEVMILPGGMQTWDRGFDAQGKQVWGSEKGPYVFTKAQPGEPT